MSLDNARPVNVLLVEDNPADVDLTRISFAEAKLKCHLHTVNDGVEAMAFLKKLDEWADAPTPDLILLDLNMPRKDGREVLAEIKENPELRRIPVIVLTSSDAEQDIVKSYDLHTNAYIQKPVDFEDLKNVVRALEDFWFTIVRLPPKETS